MYVSTVLYTVQRMAQLSALFVMAGLLCYIVGRQSAQNKPRLAFGLVCSTFVFWTPIAMLSKENGVLLPLLALTTEAAFFRLSGPDSARRYTKVLFSLFLVAPGVMAAAWLISHPDFVTGGYKFRDFTMGERLLTEPRILLSYVRGLLLPNGPALGLYHDDYVTSSSISSPWSTLPVIVMWVTMVGWFLTTTRKQVRYLLFGPVFFLVAQSLESGIFALELYFEHRNYLPGFGVYFGVSLLILEFVGRCRKRRAITVMLATVPLAFAAASYQRTSNWHSWPLLVLANTVQHPNSSRLHTELASLNINTGDMATAIKHLKTAVHLKPTMASGAVLHAQLGRCITGKQYEIDIGRQVEAYRPTVYAVTALEQLANLVDERGCDPALIRQTTILVADWLRNTNPNMIPHAWKMRFNLARLLYSSGQIDQAIDELQQAAILAPERLEPGLLTTRYQLELGRLVQAKQTLTLLKMRDSGSRRDLSRMVAMFDQLVVELESPRSR
jgi:tetratricopeptide (TPR) repeat protein